MNIVSGVWIDSHAHVFDQTCDYQGATRYRPSRFAPWQRYFDTLNACGIRGAVLVQPSFLGADNSYLCQAIAARPDRVRGVAVVGGEVSAARLAELWRMGIRAVRLNLIGLPDPDFTSPSWGAWLDRVADSGMALDLHASDDRWERLLPPLLTRELTVVVEHLGRPGFADPLDCAGFRAILAAAASGRVWVKLSAPYRSATGAAVRTLAPLLAAFGPERLLWGSDCPWTQHEEGQDMARAMAWLEQAATLDLDSAGWAAIRGGSACRLYDLPGLLGRPSEIP